MDADSLRWLGYPAATLTTLAFVPQAWLTLRTRNVEGISASTYVAFTIGATFQVSDNTIGSTKLRNLVTAHGMAAYLYNTAILAVGISLLANAVSG